MKALRNRETTNPRVLDLFIKSSTWVIELHAVSLYNEIKLLESFQDSLLPQMERFAPEFISDYITCVKESKDRVLTKSIRDQQDFLADVVEYESEEEESDLMKSLDNSIAMWMQLQERLRIHVRAFGDDSQLCLDSYMEYLESNATDNGE